MRNHPITPVTEPLQYRAIGVIRATYRPDDPACFTKGHLVDLQGIEVEAVVLGRAITLMRKHLDMSKSHLWVVYPRCRKANFLHLQIVGVWEPSTLDRKDLEDAVTQPVKKDTPLQEDKLPEGDDYFSVRGELIYTKPETSELIIKVRQKPRSDAKKTIPFKLQLKGNIAMDHLRHFVNLDVRRDGQELCLESYQVVGPVPQKPSGNRKKPTKR